METIRELAAKAFEAAERWRGMQMMNVPTDYDERKKQFIACAEAEFAMKEARRALDHALTGPPL